MKLPTLPPHALDAAVMGLVVYLGLRAFDVPILYAAPAMWVAMAAVFVWRRLRRRIADRKSYNCASCGRHQPEPSVIVTLGGEFPTADTVHAGVLVTWCKACAPSDVLHGVLVRFATERNAPATRDVLATLARRGPGRVTWLSQDTLDRVRTATGASPIEPTPERFVH